MLDISLPIPPEPLVRASVAAVWLYEGAWCKLLGRNPSQRTVVEAAPGLSPRRARAFLLLLGAVETALAVWVLSGRSPGACALAQTLLLVGLNTGGIAFARRHIHDPAGMVVKNVAFLVLAWIGAALQSGRA